VYKAAGHDQGFLAIVAIVAMAFFTVIIYGAEVCICFLIVKYANYLTPPCNYMTECLTCSCNMNSHHVFDSNHS